MTQTLDVNEGIAGLGRSHAIGAPTSATATTSKFGTFAITFGIAFAILYTVFERLNWPLFTYHPAVGKLDFWMQRARSGEGPPMYWYGWLALAFPCAAVVGWIATLVSARLLQRATVFCCLLATLWSTGFWTAVYMDDRTSFDPDLVTSLMWMSAIPALVGAAAAGYFVPIAWAQRVWTRLLLIMPIGGLLILSYSLKQYFLR
jgi:hypothetical protein